MRIIIDFKESKRNMGAVLDIINDDLAKNVHDCSKGGLAIAVSELCMSNLLGCNVSIEGIPGEKLNIDKILFSESHSRYLIAAEKKNLKKIEGILQKTGTPYKIIGTFDGKKIQFKKGKKSIIDLSVDKAQKAWLNSLRELVMHG